MISRQSQIAIIGAGPIGLEAALAAVQAGCHVNLYERGQVARNVDNWGHVRLFSPFEMNSSPRGRAALTLAGHQLPKAADYLTGRQFVDKYVQPLSQLPEILPCIHEQTTVEAVSRAEFGKGEHIGKKKRTNSPFCLLVNGQEGPSYQTADIVIDCSGTYGNGNNLGPGGLPALGEQEHLTAANYNLPDIIGEQRAEFANKTTLIVGSGYSAATAVASIGHLAGQTEQTAAYWITRGVRDEPLTRIDDDSLPIRAQLTATANQLALSSGSPINWLPGSVIQKIERDSSGQGYHVTTTNPDGKSQLLEVDQIIAHAGFHPDRSLYRELQIHECYASEGPMKLAASLLDSTSANCLDQPAAGLDTLKNPESNFYILGAKSYGRNSQFLLRTGIEQVDAIFEILLSAVSHPSKNNHA